MSKCFLNILIQSMHWYMKAHDQIFHISNSRIKQLMRHYCTEASKYGDIVVGKTQRLQKVLVLLNPAANRKSCEEDVSQFTESIQYPLNFNFDHSSNSSTTTANRFCTWRDSKWTSSKPIPRDTPAVIWRS